MNAQIKTADKDRTIRFRFTSEGTGTDFVVREGACVIESFVAVNNTSNARFLQIHDADEVPLSGTPLFSHEIPAGGSLALSEVPIYCENGAVFLVSETFDTLTMSTDEILLLVNTRL